MPKHFGTTQEVFLSTDPAHDGGAGVLPIAALVGAPMINQAELKVAAVVGALLGIITGYLVGSGGWFIMLIWALIGAVVVSGLVYCLRVFR